MHIDSLRKSVFCRVNVRNANGIRSVLRTDKATSADGPQAPYCRQVSGIENFAYLLVPEVHLPVFNYHINGIQLYARRWPSQFTARRDYGDVAPHNETQTRRRMEARNWCVSDTISAVRIRREREIESTKGIETDG